MKWTGGGCSSCTFRVLKSGLGISYGVQPSKVSELKLLLYLLNY